MGPTLAGFQWFLTSIVGIPSQYLPSDAPVIAWSYDIAFATVNQVFACVPSRTTPNKQIVYSQMVYNLATHYLVTSAPDTTVPYKHDNNQNEIFYFQYLRQSFGLNVFWAGVVEHARDETTETNIHVPENLDVMTIDDVSLTKTPWGRQYLGQAQKWNRPWGIS